MTLSSASFFCFCIQLQEIWIVTCKTANFISSLLRRHQQHLWNLRAHKNFQFYSLYLSARRKHETLQILHFYGLIWNSTFDSCCEKITLFWVQNRGSLILVLQCVSYQHLFKQTFSGCPMNFCFFWHQTCIHTLKIQLTGNAFKVANSPNFSTPKRVIFSQHASFILRGRRKKISIINLWKSMGCQHNAMFFLHLRKVITKSKWSDCNMF